MPHPLRRSLAGLPLMMTLPDPAAAQDARADVVAVRLRRNPDGTFDVAVTIRSDDTGWDRYADRFEVLAPNGTVLGVRELLHPHEDEQPFRRSLTGLRLPAGLTEVVVRARMKGIGYRGTTQRVAVPPPP
jgi:hypothetical protein